MSKSMTTVLYPRMAKPEEMAAEEVVLPTPPFPEVTTIILANAGPFLLVDMNVKYSSQFTRYC